MKSGPFTVTVTGKITCGGNGNGDAIDFSATWSGEIIECDEPVELTDADIQIVQVPPNFSAQAALGENFGISYPQQINAIIFACLGDDDRWHPRVISVVGKYSVQTSLQGVVEVTGFSPSGNTVKSSFCKQVRDLKRLGSQVVGDPTQWYVMSAIEAHEQGHVDHFWDDINAIVPSLKTQIETLSIPDEPGMTREQAISKIRNSGAFFNVCHEAQIAWFQKTASHDDHSSTGAPILAEKAIVDPLWQSICTHAKNNSWGKCDSCS